MVVLFSIIIYNCFFFKQKTAYEMRISDWSSDVCSSDLASELADIAEQTATVARAMGQEPRVAFLSYANFGNPPGKWLDTIRDAVRLLDMRGVGFEYEGEMTPDVALKDRKSTRLNSSH